MDQETKNKLKSMPRSTCSECRSKRSYRNPIAKCFECLQKFCYDHIWCMQVKQGMANSDELRSVCEKCQNQHGYHTLQ